MEPPERVRELSSKANTGQLTEPEERELENYLNVGRTRGRPLS